MIAGRACDTDAIRTKADAWGGWTNIPPRINCKGNFAFGPRVCRQRNRVAWFFSRIRYFRGLATRYDTTDANHFARLTLAAIRIRNRSCRRA